MAKREVIHLLNEDTLPVNLLDSCPHMMASTEIHNVNWMRSDSHVTRVADDLSKFL